MTNEAIKELFDGLLQCGNLKGVKLGYAIAKNNKHLKTLEESISEALTKLQVYHAKKDKEKNPIIIEGKYDMQDLEKFKKDYKELMSIENEVQLHKVTLEDLPADVTAYQMNVLMVIIDDK